jgi:predicted SpoU family rRNA methylase
MIVEQNTVTVLVTVEQDNRKDEYRKVIHKWGGQFFFKNGATCSEEIYQREAQAEQMAGAVPRGKLD